MMRMLGMAIAVGAAFILGVRVGMSLALRKIKAPKK